jgi:hypothetical protein
VAGGALETRASTAGEEREHACDRNRHDARRAGCAHGSIRLAKLNVEQPDCGADQGHDRHERCRVAPRHTKRYHIRVVPGFVCAAP